MRMSVCVGVCLYHCTHMKTRGQFMESFLFYAVGPGETAWAVSLYSKYLCWLSHFMCHLFFNGALGN